MSAVVPAVIIDASATLSWLFGEGSPDDWLVANLTATTLRAPSLWRLEVVNAIVVKERRGQISQAQGDRFLHILDSLPVEITSPFENQTLETIAKLARDHQLTSYDAVYLEAAKSSSASLCTLDNNLKSAAQRSGVELVS